jgi:uncharacterized protein
MKRDLEKALFEWKNGDIRKPLLVYGARQTGKTHLLQRFGEENFKKIHYINTG